MREVDALRAIALTAAEILGIDNRVGSLAPGKDADVVVLSAHPFDVASACVDRVLIGGETVYEHRGLAQ